MYKPLQVSSSNCVIIYLAVAHIFKKTAAYENSLVALKNSVFIMYVWNRGTTFRKQYLDVRRLRSVLGNVPVLMMTATATEKIKTGVESTMGVSQVLDIVAVPDRYHNKHI